MINRRVAADFITMIGAFILCLGFALPAGMEASLEAEVSLDREKILEGQQIIATLDIKGGTPPYQVDYEWLVYGEGAGGNSRPVFTLNGSAEGSQFSAVVDAEGDGQLAVSVTDSNGNQVYASESFGVYRMYSHSKDLDSELLLGNWGLISGDPLNQFLLALGPDRRVSISSTHPNRLWGLEEVSGQVSFDDGAMVIHTDAGEEIAYYYFLSDHDGVPVIQLEMWDMSLLDLEYIAGDFSEPTERTPENQNASAEMNADHLRVLGKWAGPGEYDKEILFSLDLTDDGNFRFEMKSPKASSFNATLKGRVKEVGDESISYVTDDGFSGYFLYWFNEDGDSIRFMYQDFSGLLNRLK